MSKVSRVNQRGRTGKTGMEVSRSSGMKFIRRLSSPGRDPFDEVEWDLRSAAIVSEKGETIFKQENIEVPGFWSQVATNVVASKYFRGPDHNGVREHSVRQVISRVVQTLAEWGRKDGIFATERDAEVFESELKAIVLGQLATFNSPVWFNVGVNPDDKPQASACFINSIEDTMDSIMKLATTEAQLFKGGSGTGTNFSSLRSSREPLSGGGKASGPVSFMKGFDAFAGVIKSGGKTRRAAKMVILNVDHPDIEEFIRAKMVEEKKAWSLIDSGYDGGINGDAYSSVFFQNSNNSVRVTDEFMGAVESDGPWTTKSVTTGEVVDTLRARDLFHLVAEVAHMCGDPGLQFDTTINRWHTCRSSGRINASNPCVTGDTLVSTAQGLVPIRDLLGRGRVEVIAKDGDPAPVTEVFRTGVKPVYLLRTRSGYTLKLTKDHPVWTANRGDVPAGELAPGDQLGLVPGRFGNDRLFATMAEFIGLLLGDGCKSGDQGQVILTMGRGEEDMLAEYVDFLNSIKPNREEPGQNKFVTSRTPMRPTSKARGGRILGGSMQPTSNAAGGDAAAAECKNDFVPATDIGGVTATPTGVRVATSAKEVTDVVDRYAVLDRGSDGKRLKEAAFLLDRDSTAALLRGLFTTDAAVGFSPDKNAYVSLDSTSLDLLRQVQQLLLLFGIKGKLYENRRGGCATSNLPDGKGGVKTYTVKEMHSLRITRNSRILFELWIGFHPRSEKARKLSELNAQVGAYNDRLTDEFESLDQLGEEEVFDLMEPSSHHFVAGGLLVHNCSEFMFIDNSACNLASLNLMKFMREDGIFDVDLMCHVVDIMVTAQEIIIDNARYPTGEITRNSRAFRPLGLGYANLGALLMACGFPYDSEEGRACAAAVTALLTGEAYAQSARLASKVGPFERYEENRECMLDVIDMHMAALDGLGEHSPPEEIFAAATQAWGEARSLGEQVGLRNAQVSVLAPTGTIGFMMDCDTMGVEPDIALIKYKNLVGGGTIRMVNKTVPVALRNLGYDPETVKAIVSHIDRKGTIEGCPELKDEHLAVFDCALRPRGGARVIAPGGHLMMMAAVQPFISGAISKTVNLPSDTAIGDIEKVYMDAWKSGVKALSVYRENSKRSQPLSTSAGTATAAAVRPELKPARRRLPDERQSITHKFNIAGHEGYIIVGMYEDGRPGEIFIKMAKEGSTISGLMDSFALAISLTLQYGVPLKALIEKFSNTRFEPSGYTSNREIPYAKSIMDYIFTYLSVKFIPKEEGEGIAAGTGARESLPPGAGGAPSEGAAKDDRQIDIFMMQSDAPMCPECGFIMVRSGACYRCINCGGTSGCS